MCDNSIGISDKLLDWIFSVSTVLYFSLVNCEINQSKIYGQSNFLSKHAISGIIYYNLKNVHYVE